MIILGCLFSLGDVACLLAAHHSVHPHSSAPNLEKFIGYRCSDHIAFVNAFTQWQIMKNKDGKEKKEFFDKHNLQIDMMELVYDMKIQLKESLKSIGFPATCLEEKPLFLRDHDSDVDMVIALLVMGLHPNICFHKESKTASEHQADFVSSFNSPFLVFGRKICTEEATYKNMTMISVAHILLFGNRNIRLLDETIEVDSWINLRIDQNVTCKLVAVRTALEIIANNVASNPKSLDSLSKEASHLLSVTKVLCTEMCEETETMAQYRISPEMTDMEPPSKLCLLDIESQSGNYKQRKGNQLDDNLCNQNMQQSLNSSHFWNNMPECHQLSDQRLISTGKHQSDSESNKINFATQKKDGDKRISKVHVSVRSQRNAATNETGRASTFLVNRNDSDYYQRRSSARSVDSFRTAFYSSGESSRVRSLYQSTHKSDSRHWDDGS